MKHPDTRFVAVTSYNPLSREVISSEDDVNPLGPVQLKEYAPGGETVIRIAPLNGALQRSLSTIVLVMEGVTETSLTTIAVDAVHPDELSVTSTA
jgi:hypothetical protein